MMHVSRLLLGLAFMVVTLFCFSDPPLTRAQDITLVPSISLRGEFDDNVAFVRDDEIDDYVGIVSPAFTLDYASELLELAASAILDIRRYADESDFNDEIQRYRLNGGYQMAERWRVNGNFAYTRDTTLESELEETGIVNRRQERERFDAGGGLSYQLTELSDIGVNYDYRRVDYDEEGLEDYYVNTVGFSYNRRFNAGLDTLSVRPSYNNFHSDVSDVDGYRLTVAWIHLPSETYRLEVALGARYTIEDYEFERDTARNWGGLGDINLRKTGETYSARIGFNSDVYYDPSAREIIQVYRLYGEYTRRILERLSTGINGRVSLTKPDDEDSIRDDDIWYFTVTPFLSYQLTENHFLRLNYSYQQEYDTNLDDERVDRNRIWLSLNFNFPYKW